MTESLKLLNNCGLLTLTVDNKYNQPVIVRADDNCNGPRFLEYPFPIGISSQQIQNDNIYDVADHNGNTLYQEFAVGQENTSFTLDHNGVIENLNPPNRSPPKNKIRQRDVSGGMLPPVNNSSINIPPINNNSSDKTSISNWWILPLSFLLLIIFILLIIYLSRERPSYL